jgi:hypothetical protein
LTSLAEYYIIVGGDSFLNEHSAPLQTMLVNQVGEVSPRGQAHVTLVTEALLKRFPVEGGLLLLQCGVLKRYVNACSLSWSESKDSEPDRVIVSYLTTMARVFLGAPVLLDNGVLFSDVSFGVKELVR